MKKPIINFWKETDIKKWQSRVHDLLIVLGGLSIINSLIFLGLGFYLLACLDAIFTYFCLFLLFSKNKYHKDTYNETIKKND